MKSKRILIYRLTPLENMGIAATLLGLITGIRNCMPDAEIVVTSYIPNKYKYLEKKGIKLVQHPWWRPWGKMWPLSLVILIPYDQYDVVIDNNTEYLKDELYGSFSVTISLLQTYFARVILGRPLATTPSSVGPFKTRLNKWLARQILNKVDLLALREESNYGYCIQLGLNKSNVYFVSDPGFLMPPIG